MSFQHERFTTFFGPRVQVLKACFTVPTHQTVVVATVSPAPTDLTHTVNTLEHVSFMAAPLGKLSKTVTVELPLANVGAINKPIQKWTNEEVVAFVATTAVSLPCKRRREEESVMYGCRCCSQSPVLSISGRCSHF